MKTLVAVRVPDELLEKVDARGTRTDVILEALRAYLEVGDEKSESVGERSSRRAGAGKRSVVLQRKGTAGSGIAVRDGDGVAAPGLPADERGLPGGGARLGSEGSAGVGVLVVDPGSSEFVQCKYTEYDQETGETYRCRLAVHGPKVKHVRGEML
jgi:hypothetical protein